MTRQPCLSNWYGTACAVFSGYRDAPTTAIVIASQRMSRGLLTLLTLRRDRLQPPQQRPGGGQHEGALVRERVLEPAVPVGSGVAEVAGDQGGAEVRADHDDVPLLPQRVVAGEGGAAHARRGLGA